MRHVPVARLDGRAFHDRQQIALHALPRNIGAARFAGNHLVDLVQENDPQVLGQLDRLGIDLLRFQQRIAFLFEEHVAGLRDRHLPRGGLAGHDLLEHALQIHVHVLHAHAAEDDRASPSARRSARPSVRPVHRRPA